MKDRFFFEDSLEQHLREKSDEFKMYPSDKIWANIDNALHARRKRFIAFMTFLVAGILLVAGTEFFGPSRPINTASRVMQTQRSPEPPPLDLSQFNTTAPPSGRPGASGGQSPAQTTVVRVPFVSATDGLEPGKITRATNLQHISLDPGIIGAALPASLSNYRLPVASAPAGDPVSPDPELQAVHPNATVVGASPRETETTDFSGAEKTNSRKLKGDRFGWELYVTPTIVSRRLSGLEYQRLNPNISNGPITVVRYANVSGFVDNTPVVGYDIGGNLKYRISPRLSVKAGLAFNFSRYYIQTYNSQPSFSSPVVNTYLGYIADSLVTQNAPSSGFGEPKSQQRLQNQYYTLSVPVGVEWKVAGKGRLEVYLGANIQPGYLLNRNAYTISSDYGSYEKNPAAFNRWNLNTGAEAFISYRVGKTRWELGPQVRYQLFSSYKTGSPLRENLVIYGIRLGFSKSNW